MREILAMHARSHLMGGSDPLEIEIPHIFGRFTTQNVTGSNQEFEFVDVITNDRNTFAWDPTDPAGLLLKRDGFYLGMAWGRYSVGDSATVRNIQIVGNATDFAQWYSDGGGQQTAPWSVTATSEPKLNLSQIGIGSYSLIDPTAPVRVSVVLGYNAVNYTVQDGTLWVFRVSRGGATPPLPPTA